MPFGNTKVFTQWHVPIDDENHYWYMIFYDFQDETDKETLLAAAAGGCTLPDYRPTATATTTGASTRASRPS